MSKRTLVLFLMSFFFISSCQTSSLTAERGFAPRAIASDEVIWVAHPCQGQKGVPYKSVHSFAVKDGVIYARTSENTEPRALTSERAGNGQGWNNVEQFFNERGFKAKCSATQGEQKPPKKSGHHEKSKDFNPADERVMAPVNFDMDAYYAPLKELGGDLRDNLHVLLSSPHWQLAGQSDSLATACPANQPLEALQGKVCVQQHIYSYDGARKIMFGDPSFGDFRKNANGKYEVYDYYCQEWRSEDDFKDVVIDKKTGKHAPLGPGLIPAGTVMNAEHSWPQSKFTDSEGTRMALTEKSDLHHIFPTDSEVNRIRANNEFAEVDRSTAQAMHCSDGYSGDAIPLPGTTIKEHAKYFEPPTRHKGDVARALFYFSVRFNAGMSALQEAYLRKWNRQDPPDVKEIKRNQAVYRVSGVRNPFVDHPDWVDQISRFCHAKDPGQPASEYDCASN